MTQGYNSIFPAIFLCKVFSVHSLKNPGRKMVNSCLELHLIIIASPFHTLLSLSIQNEINYRMKILSNRYSKYAYFLLNVTVKKVFCGLEMQKVVIICGL